MDDTYPACWATLTGNASPQWHFHFSSLLPLAHFLSQAVQRSRRDIRKTRPLASLEGSEWGPETTSTTEQFVAFKSDGEIIGHGGCNAFFGQYTQEAQTLTIGALASTKKMCPEIMEAEAAFLSSLQEARRIDATHSHLKLYDANDDLVLQLRRRDWD